MILSRNCLEKTVMHAKTTPRHLWSSKRLIMVCVRQETSNTMFTVLSLNLASGNVLTTITNVPYMANSRLFFIAVTQSFWTGRFLFSLCFDLTHARTVDLRLLQVTEVTQQLSIDTFTATVQLRHVERSEFHLTVQDTWLLTLGCWKM